MGVATTYNPGSMPRRCNALLFFVLATMATPAFSADPSAGTTFSDDIDPATGLARSSVVRPLGDAPPVPIVGAGTLEEKFRQLGTELGFGTITVEDAVSQFFSEMDVVLNQ